MFRPFMCPFSGRCITKYRHIDILQKFLNQFTDIIANDDQKDATIFGLFIYS